MSSTPSIKELPHDLLAEKSLLSSLLIDSSSYDQISDLHLKREDFFSPQYGVIFEAIKDLILSNSAIDYVTLCSKLTDMGKIEQLGGKSFVLEIYEDQAYSGNIYHYAKIVKDKASLRDIVRIAQRVYERGINYTGDAQEFLQEAEASFFKITNDGKTGKMLKLNACLKANLKDLEDTSRSYGQIVGIPSGYNKLDELLLGFQPGQLIVLAARPAMGKTALALNLALRACELATLPVAIFSYEMAASELSLRLLSGKAKVDSKKLKTKNFLDNELRSIGMAVQALSPLPIYVNDSGSTTVLDIQSQCRKIKAEQGLGLVMIDYLQLMRSHTNNPSREQQVSEISRHLKLMAKELECPVIALSQLNRQVESRPNKRPNTADLRESGAIEQDADIIMFIYRDEVYNPESKDKGIAEIIVGKNRSGEIGTVRLAWVGSYTSFENLHT